MINMTDEKKKLTKLPYSPMIKATTDSLPTKRRLYGI